MNPVDILVGEPSSSKCVRWTSFWVCLIKSLNCFKDLRDLVFLHSKLWTNWAHLPILSCPKVNYSACSFGVTGSSISSMDSMLMSPFWERSIADSEIWCGLSILKNSSSMSVFARSCTSISTINSLYWLFHLRQSASPLFRWGYESSVDVKSRLLGLPWVFSFFFNNVIGWACPCQ